MEEVKIYHGSKQIVRFPEIRTAKYHKDFYFGFYCTAFPEQAKRWAVRYSGIGVINEYQYRRNDALRILTFEEMTESGQRIK